MDVEDGRSRLGGPPDRRRRVRRSSVGRQVAEQRLGQRLCAGAVLAAVLAATGPAAAQSGEEAPLVIGSGAVLGLYFPVAGALASLADHGNVLVESTGGSLENLVRLRQGDLDMAVVRSDLAYEAALGLDAFSIDEPYGELRTVMTLHPEPLLIIASADSGIRSLDDVDGQRIQLGEPGSATAELFELVLGTQQWPEERFVVADPVPLAEQTDGLCAGDFDMMAFISGAPSGTVYEALSRCGAHLVSVEGTGIDTLLLDHPALVEVTVPPGRFPGVDRPVHAVGPVALLVTTAAEPEERVANFVTAVVEDLPRLRAQHPSLADLDIHWLATAAHVVPLHDGAAAAYEALGAEE